MDRLGFVRNPPPPTYTSDVDHSHRIELTHNHSLGVISVWVIMLSDLFVHGHSRETPMDLPTRTELIP